MQIKYYIIELGILNGPYNYNCFDTGACQTQVDPQLVVLHDMKTCRVVKHKIFCRKINCFHVLLRIYKEYVLFAIKVKNVIQLKYSIS